VPNLKDVTARSVSAAHEIAYRMSGGFVGGWIGGMPVLLLTTTGRRTGKQRTTPLTYFEIDGRILIVASYGGDERHPAWYLNLDADPDVVVERGSRRDQMTARTLSPSERDDIWPRITRRNPMYESYQRNTERRIPVVELVPGTGPPA
jgi:deazaflavin-dependent oxidoreductase (nitroreductase family)